MAGHRRAGIRTDRHPPRTPEVSGCLIIVTVEAAHAGAGAAAWAAGDADIGVDVDVDVDVDIDVADRVVGCVGDDVAAMADTRPGSRHRLAMP